MRGHRVSEIAHSESGPDNLGATASTLTNIIDQARTNRSKCICFLTGVPGSGKTLAGLNLASEQRRADAEDPAHAVFLSGNGPLVKVLQEAPARDAVEQAKLIGTRLAKKDTLRKAVAVIQNIHHFRDHCLDTEVVPAEHVVIFDEAQRAWNTEQTSKFRRQKRDLPDFNESEPAFLIHAMDRHADWSVIVCLVGGGQEINTGEAGIEEWLRAIRDTFPHWNVYLPSQLDTREYLPTMRLAELGNRVTQDPLLHLDVSIRSFRSEKLSARIGALLEGPFEAAQTQLAGINQTYPLRITRSAESAKEWVRQRARGTERYGILISSGGRAPKIAWARYRSSEGQ